MRMLSVLIQGWNATHFWVVCLYCRLVEASDLTVLRKKSSFYHQSLTLIGKLVDEFAGDCEAAT